MSESQQSGCLALMRPADVIHSGGFFVSGCLRAGKDFPLSSAINGPQGSVTLGSVRTTPTTTDVKDKGSGRSRSAQLSAGLSAEHADNRECKQTSVCSTWSLPADCNERAASSEDEHCRASTPHRTRSFPARLSGSPDPEDKSTQLFMDRREAAEEEEEAGLSRWRRPEQPLSDLHKGSSETCG